LPGFFDIQGKILRLRRARLRSGSTLNLPAESVTPQLFWHLIVILAYDGGANQRIVMPCVLWSLLMNPRGVIFDMDGVIVLTENAHWQSWLAVAEPRGVMLRYDTFLSCFGRINPDCIPILFGPDISTAESADIADRKEAAFRDIIRADMPLAPGIVALLSKLEASGASLAVGSSAPPENVALVLDAGNIRSWFDAIVDGSQVKRGKPAPDVFLRAAELMGISPKDCVVIEDAPTGIKAAVAAGMLAVGVATTHKAEELQAVGAHHCFETLADVPMDMLLGRS
jgi:beta-phosphoglucomutase